MNFKLISYQDLKKKILIPMIIIIGILIVNFSYKMYYKVKNQYCYTKCSEYHYLNESIHWHFTEYIIDSSDSLWVDQECYNDWCICIDECNAGLCCELLK